MYTYERDFKKPGTNAVCSQAKKFGCVHAITTHDIRLRFSVAHMSLFCGTIEHRAWSMHRIQRVCEVRSGPYTVEFKSTIKMYHKLSTLYIHTCTYVFCRSIHFNVYWPLLQ